MVSSYLIIVLLALALCEAAPPSRSRQVQFIKSGSNKRQDTPTKKSSQRPTRSYGNIDVEIELWREPSFQFAYPPQSNSLVFNFERNGHVTPDFTNGLDYPDPLLLTGVAAKKAVTYLYSRELFFADIPHLRAILRNQEVRRANGLSGNRLGSLRDGSPFYRYKHQRGFRQF